MLSISLPELTGRLAVLLEVRCSEVVDFVLLQEGVELHPRRKHMASHRIAPFGIFCKKSGVFC